MEAKKLTKITRLKYQAIVDEWFINGFNGSDAWKKFSGKKLKTTTATVNFSRMQIIPEISEYIKAKHREASKIVNATHEGILRELRNWVESDITETMMLSEEEIKNLPVEVRRLITKYKKFTKQYYDKGGALIGTDVMIELHFVSKERAVEMINKHIGFYEKDNDQKTPKIDYSSLSSEILESIWNARTKP